MSFIKTDKWKALEEGKEVTIKGIDIRPIDGKFTYSESNRLSKLSFGRVLVIHLQKNRPEIKDFKSPPPVKVAPNSEQTWYTSYLVGDDVLYMSDVAGIPEDKVDLLTNLSPKVLIIDCIDTQIRKPHPAHFNLIEALAWAKIINPGRTYLTGIHHNTAHQTYLWLLDVRASDDPAEASKKFREKNSDFDEWNTGYINNLKEVKKKVKEIMADDSGNAVMVVKPAYDGLCIVIGDDGKVYDDDD